MSGIAPCVAVLREYGALDLREITRLTAGRLGMSVMYADVDVALEREREAGLVELKADADDYRKKVWEASAQSEGGEW